MNWRFFVLITLLSDMKSDRIWILHQMEDYFGRLRDLTIKPSDNLHPSDQNKSSSLHVYVKQDNLWSLFNKQQTIFTSVNHLKLETST